MKVETDMPTFQRLTKCLAEIYPQATAELLASDPALRDLGFVHEIPCTIEVHATQEQINEIKEMAIQFEIDAINSADGTARTTAKPIYTMKNMAGYSISSMGIKNKKIDFF